MYMHIFTYSEKESFRFEWLWERMENQIAVSLPPPPQVLLARPEKSTLRESLLPCLVLGIFMEKIKREL